MVSPSVELQNTSAANSTNDQYSPALRFTGNLWTGSVSSPVSWDLLVRPFFGNSLNRSTAIWFSPFVDGTRRGGVVFDFNIASNIGYALGTYILGLDGSNNTQRVDNSGNMTGFGPVNAGGAFGYYSFSTLWAVYGNGWTGLTNGAFLGFSGTGSNSAGGFDVRLFRDAAGVLALRNSANPQTSRIYNTWTNASQGEWFEVSWADNICTITTKANGLGTTRPLIIKYPSVTLASLPLASSVGAGARSFISDSTNPMAGFVGEIVSGGGSFKVPVHSDGSNWRIG